MSKRPASHSFPRLCTDEHTWGLLLQFIQVLPIGSEIIEYCNTHLKVWKSRHTWDIDTTKSVIFLNDLIHNTYGTVIILMVSNMYSTKIYVMIVGIFFLLQALVKLNQVGTSVWYARGIFPSHLTALFPYQLFNQLLVFYRVATHFMTTACSLSPLQTKLKVLRAFLVPSVTVDSLCRWWESTRALGECWFESWFRTCWILHALWHWSWEIPLLNFVRISRK